MPAPRLYTLTPNPALDLSGHVASIVPNEKNAVFEARRDPGGNGINAARVARRLGARAVALGFLGGPAGSEIEALLDAEGLSQAFIPIRGHTRTNVTVTNDKTHSQTRLTFPGPQVTSREVQRLLRQIHALPAKSVLALGGSLPSGLGPEFYLSAARAAAQRGLQVVVDVPGPLLKTFVGSRVRSFLTKPNVAELEACLARKLGHLPPAALASAARPLLRSFENVIVSLGPQGALLITEEGAYRGLPPKIRARGTVGAGDSMVGGFCAAVLRGRPLLECFAWGLAAGAATAEAQGTHLGGARRIRALRPQVQIARLT